jgi:hypothetical protein
MMAASLVVFSFALAQDSPWSDHELLLKSASGKFVDAVETVIEESPLTAQQKAAAYARIERELHPIPEGTNLQVEHRADLAFFKRMLSDRLWTFVSASYDDQLNQYTFTVSPPAAIPQP